MRISLIIIIIFFSLSILGCRLESQNVKSIGVQGTILDSMTHEVLKNAKVTAICWYDAGFDKTDYVSKDTMTDDSGRFSFNFDEGIRIEIAAAAQDYAPKIATLEVTGNGVTRTSLQLRPYLGYDARSINLRNLII